MKTERYEVKITTYPNGDRNEAWFHQNGQLHRLDGPAVVRDYANGSHYEYWYRNDKFHREDGPAIIRMYADGERSEEWYRNGVGIDPKEDTCAGRVVNIDGREYRLEPVNV